MNLRGLLKILITLCTLCLAANLLYMIVYETTSLVLLSVVMISFCADIFLTILYLTIVIEEAPYDDQYVKMSADRYNKRR